MDERIKPYRQSLIEEAIRYVDAIEKFSAAASLCESGRLHEDSLVRLRFFYAKRSAEAELALRQHDLIQFVRAMRGEVEASEKKP